MTFWKNKPHLDTTSVGNLLIERGLCTEGQLREALSYQVTNKEVLLGELLVKMGAVREEQLDIVRARQEIARSNGRGKGISKLAKIAQAKAEAIVSRVDQFLETETSKT